MEFYVLGAYGGGATRPFFLFFSRERDDGMPPRRRPQSAYIPQQNEVPPQSEPEI